MNYKYHRERAKRISENLKDEPITSQDIELILSKSLFNLGDSTLDEKTRITCVKMDLYFLLGHLYKRDFKIEKQELIDKETITKNQNYGHNESIAGWIF